MTLQAEIFNFACLKKSLNRSQQDLCYAQSLYAQEQLLWKVMEEKEDHLHDFPVQMDFYKMWKQVHL